jgi:hypothetical protein
MLLSDAASRLAPAMLGTVSIRAKITGVFHTMSSPAYERDSRYLAHHGGVERAVC